MKYDKDGRVYLRPERSERVYQQGPNTRVYVTKRSWLDAGTEVLPGDRKFQDYAFPPAIGYPSFARENLNRPIDRQPLNPPSDLGGYPPTIPAVLSGQRWRFTRIPKMPGSAPGFRTMALATRVAYACSACNSFRIASPICVVLTAVVPSDLMSAVRRPLASTAAIAASTLSASAPMSNE